MSVRTARPKAWALPLLVVTGVITLACTLFSPLSSGEPGGGATAIPATPSPTVEPPHALGLGDTQTRS